MSGLNGVLLVDKPAGCTSAAVVRVLKKALAAEKIGHLGTLDPFASGLLPLCVGAGAKIAQFLMAERKAYMGTIRLGVETDTLDTTGKVVRTAPVPLYEPELLREMARRFSGVLWQIPPMYSALKKNGVPLYKLARQGQVVERKPRQVRIDDFTLTSVGSGILSFALTCSKGTYVRSLAADLGAALGCGAHLLTLRRTAFGPFSIQDAAPLSSLLAGQSQQRALPLLSLSQALGHYRSVPLSPQATRQVRRGQQDVLRDLLPPQASSEIVQLIAPNKDLVALAEERQGQWRLVRVFSALQ